MVASSFDASGTAMYKAACNHLGPKAILAGYHKNQFAAGMVTKQSAFAAAHAKEKAEV